jgi:hypothetical protein
MANPIVAGIVADLISAHPGWTPDQVKGALTYVSDAIDETGKTRANVRLTADGAWAVAGDKALNAARRELQSNARLVASTLLDPVMFTIPTRASWGRASWRTAAGDLRASWERRAGPATAQAPPARTLPGLRGAARPGTRSSATSRRTTASSAVAPPGPRGAALPCAKRRSRREGLAKTGKLRTASGRHAGAVQSGVFTPVGRFLVTVGDDANAILWDVRAAQATETFHGRAGRVRVGIADLDDDRGHRIRRCAQRSSLRAASSWARTSAPRRAERESG